MKTASLVTICIVAGFLGASPTVHAQDKAPKWTVGALGMGYYSPFAAERKDAKVVPYISYRGERFYVQGLEMGYRFIKPSDSDLQLQFDVIASGRALAGSSRSKITADAGLRMGVAGGFGFLNVSGVRDITDNSNGYEAKATFGHSFEGARFSFTPSVSVVWQDEKMADYMWGVTQKQQDKMVKDNKPVLPLYTMTESVINYSANMVFTYRMTDSISLIAFADATKLDKKVQANPGISVDYEATLGLGVGYSF